MKKDKKPTLAGRAVNFMRHGLWETRPADLPLFRRHGVKLLRLGTLAVSGFKRSQCSLRAASLTFFSLMALIPVLAMTLAMARAFGGAELAKEQLNRQLDNWMVQMEQAAEAKALEAGVEAQAGSGQHEITKTFSTQVREVADKLFAQIDQLGFGTLGGIGAVMLLWTVISVLGKVESSFNEVWGVEKPRTLVRKFADYLAVIMILPFLITAASTVPVAAMATRFMDQTVGGTASDAFRSLLNSGLFKTSVTLVTGTLTFAFLLGFMPNARVKTVPALAGGFVTVVLFAGWLKLCAMLQIGIAKYSALYGGFAVLPILLMWVYTSWQIILLGSEIAFALQNRDTYRLEESASQASPRARVLLALALCAETARHAKEKAGGPFAAEEFARRHEISHRFTKDILEDLVRQKILAEIQGKPGEYLLCRCGDTLTVADIAKAMLDDGAPLEALGMREPSAPVKEFSLKLDATLDDVFATPLAEA
ncbi:MAG: YihY family inner membrane protein [Lentisphaerae bacterium]|nr:YhjD/YihY/BrkB family envelope integrity protein [Kiritimatiellia bacterium]NLC81549.1 YihY family inner membrane protein [Lentisphaerota bacterium]